MSITQISSSPRPELPHGRRTVLVATGGGSEAFRISISEMARRAGWSVIDLTIFGMKIPQPCRPDGVLFWLGREDVPFVKRMLRLGVPIVQISDTTMPQKCCCVVEDRLATGRAAAQHFAERGFRNMAYLHAEIYEDSQLRLLGESFIEHARALGATADLIAVQRPGRAGLSWDRFDALARRFKREISRLELPLGIFTYHDIMATRICHYCRAIGLSVPEQVAVLGLGNETHRCDFAATPLSSVDPNYNEMGRIAAETLDRLMDGQAPPARPILVPPVGIVTRQSTDVLAVADLVAARGLRYIWEHLAKPLTVSQIAQAVAVSRRKLERHFRQYLGRSVAEELTRKRIERACELLTGTKLSARAIAKRLGFRTETYFGKVFRKKMKTTSKKYRRAHAAKLREAQEPETPGRE